MRIALISYEFFGLAASGGIGTYMRNVATMMAARGHHIEVFTSSDIPYSKGIDAGVVVHGIVSKRQTFSENAALEFLKRNVYPPFDVAEGAEYGADSEQIYRLCLTLPLVVKLHTPTSLISEINNTYVSRAAKARFIAGSVVRGKLPKPFWQSEEKHCSLERDHARSADLVTGPSRAILDKYKAEWGLCEYKTLHVPNVFIPSPRLVSAGACSCTKRVTYIGRLEVRKGVLDLADAIPHVCKVLPDVTFRVIGRTLPMPGSQQGVQSVMIRKLSRYLANVEFVDGVPYADIPKYLVDSDVCVFPSIWENFPNVCLEAMAAARGVIGSSAGGMSEIIEHGRTGLLVPPRNPRAIADAILQLLSDPDRRIAMGLAARQHVLSAYSPDVIGPLQEASYLRAIENAKARLQASMN